MIPLTLTGRSFIERQEWVPRSVRCGWDSAKQLYFAYLDYRGNWTFGPGILIADGHTGPGEYATGRTEQQTDDIFEHLIETRYGPAIDTLNQRLTDAGQPELSPNESDAWYDFVWNEGVGALEPYNADGSVHNSAVVALITGHRDQVPTLLLRWDVSSGQHDPVLHNRRAAEGFVMTHPYADDHDHVDTEHVGNYLVQVGDTLVPYDAAAQAWALQFNLAADESPTRNDLRSPDQVELEAKMARDTIPAPDEIPPTDRNS